LDINKRTSRLKLSISFNLVLKIINITLGLLLVPILLNLLGKEKYGIWVTIFTFIGWLNIFDLGLGEGLKLKLTEAFSLQKTQKINKLITSTYFFTFLVTAVLLLLFLIINFFVNWSLLLGINNYSKEVNSSIYLLVLVILLIFIVKIIGTIYAAFQLPFVDNVIKTFGQFLFLSGLLLLSFTDIKLNLIWVTALSLVPTFLIYLGFNLFFFNFKASFLLPRVKNICKKTLKEVVKPGFSFFVIQVGCIILYSSDNVIILKLFSANEVADYSIYYKYYSFPFMFYGLFISSHWNAFIDAIAKNDFSWIKKKILFFKKLLLLLIVSYVFIYFVEKEVLWFWVGKENINIDPKISINMIIYFIISSYTTIYMYVINAYGKLYIQLISYIVITIINIPLSIYLATYFSLGSSGVILASSLCLFILAILIPIQYKKIVTHKIAGIWNK
jgi:O-antigen/teichoic acid export membrane protein